MEVALVACGRAKRSHPCEAQRMYLGLNFRDAWDYARMTTDEQFIISAKYGLLSPTDVIAPYDVTLHQQGWPARRAWAESLCAALEQRLPPDTRRVHVHASRPYYNHGLLAWLEGRGCAYTVHAKGLQQGYRHAYYTQALTTLTRPTLGLDAP